MNISQDKNSNWAGKPENEKPSLKLRRVTSFFTLTSYAGQARLHSDQLRRGRAKSYLGRQTLGSDEPR